jgi:acyl carrier protein|tara:strand:- start:403 stop:639 length:237 start_codon:yes stop_codon:yes gene_type:complete
MELFSEIKTMIEKILAVDAETVTKDAHLQFDLGADSLALLTLSIAISKKYSIELRAEDLVELENIDELVSLIESKINT